MPSAHPALTLPLCTLLPNMRISGTHYVPTRRSLGAHQATCRCPLSAHTPLLPFVAMVRAGRRGGDHDVTCAGGGAGTTKLYLQQCMQNANCVNRMGYFGTHRAAQAGPRRMWPYHEGPRPPSGPQAGIVAAQIHCQFVVRLVLWVEVVYKCVCVCVCVCEGVVPFLPDLPGWTCMATLASSGRVAPHYSRPSVQARGTSLHCPSTNAICTEARTWLAAPGPPWKWGGSSVASAGPAPR